MSFFQPVALQPGESLNSLLMRKAELNGYQSAHALLLEAGLSMKTRYSPTELEQLSDCFEIKESDLAEWSCRQDCYLDQSEFLRSACSPVCGACLAKNGYAHEAWSHLLVTACSIHQTALLSQCPQCDSPVRLGRLELKRCDCGFDFRSAQGGHAFGFAVGLSALIANVPSPARQTLPEPIDQMVFEPLMPAFLVMLAKHQGQRAGLLRPKLRFGKASSFEDSVALLNSLEALLGTWPVRFDEILAGQLINGEGVGLSMRIGSWFRGLFSTYTGRSFDFVRNRLTALVAEHFDGRLSISNRALMFGPDNTESLQWFSASEAARLVGVAPDILANLVINQKVAGRVHQEGNSRFVAIHRTTVNGLIHNRASYLSATEARQKLSVSKVFFDRFIQAGGLHRYKPSERPVLVAGEFLLSEVDSVIAALIGRVRKKPRVSQPIGIQDISAKHGVSNSKIISVLQDVLQGTICATGHMSSLSGLAGLQFDKAEIEQRVRDNDPDIAFSVEHLAQVSGWKPSVIKKWIQGGYLRAVQERHGKTRRDVVPLSALIQFLLTYTPTSELSKELGTQTNYLLQSLRPAKIECIVPPQEMGGTQRGLLLRTTDLVQGAQLRKTFGDVADRWRAGSCTAVEGVSRQVRC
tara:strand:+ start:8252 stop:10162 length:1911 start_codon:yes stop_codon:yes gene_type:complete